MSTTISTNNPIDNSGYTYESDGTDDTAVDIYNYLHSYSEQDITEQTKPKENDNRPHHPHVNPGPDGKIKWYAPPAKIKDYSGVNRQNETTTSNTSANSNASATTNTNNNSNNDKLVSSDPAFILARFRAGDKELFKLLSDPALGPILMAKIQDATAAETRLYTLLSNLQKSKDETLKAIVNNIR